MLHPFLAVNIRFSWCFDLIFAYFCRFSYFSCTILAVSVCSKTHCFPLCLGLPTRPRHRPGLQCPGCEWLRMAAILQNDVFHHFRGKIRCNILQSPAILPQFFTFGLEFGYINMIVPYCTTISDLNLRWFYFLASVAAIPASAQNPSTAIPVAVTSSAS